MFLFLFKKVKWIIFGLFMGIADVIPGVSGGTIAFILGIYNRFIIGIKSEPQRLIILITSLIKPKQINRYDLIKKYYKQTDIIKFFIPIFLGIIISIILFSAFIHQLLENSPIIVWSFFFGLILASVPFTLKRANSSSNIDWLFFCLGIFIAIQISTSSIIQSEKHTLIGIFFSGFIAITAMLLPGISGSFLLLLMGKYKYIIGHIKELKSILLSFQYNNETFQTLLVLIIFASGCIAGIILTSHLIYFLLKKYSSKVLMLLSGLMLGSLYIVWPWKLSLNGQIIPTNRLPSWSQANDQIFIAFLFMFFGILIIWFLSKIRMTDTNNKSINFN